MKFTRSLIVGIAMGAVLVGAATFALLSPRLGGQTTHEMKVIFPSADGLVSGSDVLEAGTKIGTISDIEPQMGNSAVVTLDITSDHWPLHQGISADIRPKSLLGEKYVDLHDGPQSGVTYDSAVVLHASTNADPVELDQFINSLNPPTRTAIRVLLDDLGAGVAGQGNNLNTAIAAGRANLANLAVFGKTLNDRDPDLDRILVGLEGVLAKITTNDQLNQMSQLITNGQQVLNDIETVQAPFSRGFSDANAALADLNVALDGAIPSLRSTLNIAPALVSNLQQETTLLAELGTTVTTQENKSPNNECNRFTQADQPISSLTGLQQCSPLWMLIRGLLSGPSITTGAIEKGPGRQTINPVFRICVNNTVPQQSGLGACDEYPVAPGVPNLAAFGGSMHGEGAMIAAFLGT